LQNYNSYWDRRANANQPRKFFFAKNYALPKSSPTEVYPETNLNANSAPFELTKEDFPVLPGIPKATLPRHAQASAPLAKASAELSSEALSPLLPCVRKNKPATQAQDSTPLENARSEADMGGKSQSFELSNEDFPFLPKVCSETHKDGKFELSKKNFPLLKSSQKTFLSEPAKVTKQAKSVPSPNLKNIAFGTLNYSQSVRGQSLSTESSKKEDGGVSFISKNCDGNSKGGK